ncbi:O-antigen ligase family protein [Marinoscillum sp. 108]|uniref:O-antigen ligase family protein n=1 Tax=Marinoscillum sp. 108 TaxID=2653151 RepID=UPI0013593ADC|nr:O-antigen ligase family protein [Marinoscillum sp. 108]
MLIPLTLFFVFLVLVLRLKYAIIIWLSSYHFDLVAMLDSSGIESISFNFLRLLVIPSVVYLRIVHAEKLTFHYNKSLIYAVSGVLVLTLSSSILSGLHIEAVKQYIYLLNFVISYFILQKVLSKDWLNNSYIYLIFFPLVFAILQTYFLGHYYGGVNNQRFTTFTSPQTYALYLVVLFILINDYSKRKGAKEYLFLIIILIQLLLTGSRYSLILFGATFILDFMTLKRLKLKISTLLIIVATVVGVLGIGSDAISKLRGLDFIASSNSASVTEIGTIKFRVAIWLFMFNDFMNSSVFYQAVGQGICSTGTLMIEMMPAYTEANMDYNRIAHNEFLRVIYEFGVIGIIVFVAFLWRLSSTIKSEFTLMLKFSIILIGALSIENIFAASGGPSGVALVLMYTGILNKIQVQEDC